MSKPELSSSYCARCGGLNGRIQHVDIAWPDGRHIEIWLHPECEAEFVEHLEQSAQTATSYLTSETATAT